MNAHSGMSLGTLCRRGHDHEGTGKSLRSRGACVECINMNNRETSRRRREREQRWRARQEACFAQAVLEGDPPPRRERAPDIRWNPREGPLTLEEVGYRLGITRERVRQIEVQALAKLRRRFGHALIGWLFAEHDPQPPRYGRVAGDL